jgi:hypothetical protein
VRFGGHHVVGQVGASRPDRHAVGRLLCNGRFPGCRWRSPAGADAAERFVTAAVAQRLPLDAATGRDHRLRETAPDTTPDSQRPCKTAAVACPCSNSPRFRSPWTTSLTHLASASAFGQRLVRRLASARGREHHIGAFLWVDGSGLLTDAEDALGQHVGHHLTTCQGRSPARGR